MDKQKPKNKKSTKKNAQTSKKKKEDLEVFVLSPDILKKLGINLNNVPSNSKLSVDNLDIQKTDVGDVRDNASCSSIETTPKLVPKPMKKQTTSLLETAMLMKKSVLLSPTFIPSNTNEMSGEVEIANVSKNDTDIKQPSKLLINNINNTSPKYTSTPEKALNNIKSQKGNKNKKGKYHLATNTISPEKVSHSSQEFDNQETCIVHVPVEYGDKISAEHLQDSSFLPSVQVTNQPMYTYNTDNNFSSTNDISNSNNTERIGTNNYDIHTYCAGLPSNSIIIENNALRGLSQVDKQQLISVPEFIEKVNPIVLSYEDGLINQFQFNPNVLQQPVPEEDNPPTEQNFISDGLNSSNINDEETTLTSEKLPDIDLIFDENGECLIELPAELESGIECIGENMHEKNDINSDIRYIDQFTEPVSITDNIEGNIQNVDEQHNNNTITSNLMASIVNKQIETNNEVKSIETNMDNETNLDISAQYNIQNPMNLTECNDVSLSGICLLEEKLQINTKKSTNYSLKSYTRPSRKVNTKHTDNILQKCIQGVEKPGGLTNTTNIDSEKSLRTYQRNETNAKPISCAICVNSETIPQNFCLGSDFGRLAFYGSVHLYTHLHFWDKHSVTDDPEIIFGIYGDYSKPIFGIGNDAIDMNKFKTSDETVINNSTEQITSVQCFDLMLVGKDIDAYTTDNGKNTDTSTDIHSLGIDKELKEDSNSAIDTKDNEKDAEMKNKILSVLHDDMKMDKSKNTSEKCQTVLDIKTINSVENEEKDKAQEFIEIGNIKFYKIDYNPNNASVRKNIALNVSSQSTYNKKNKDKNISKDTKGNIDDTESSCEKNTRKRICTSRNNIIDNIASNISASKTKELTTAESNKEKTHKAGESKTQPVKVKSKFKNISNEKSTQDVAGTNKRTSRSSIINKVEDKQSNSKEVPQEPSTPKAQPNADKESNTKTRLSKLRNSSDVIIESSKNKDDKVLLQDTKEVLPKETIQNTFTKRSPRITKLGKKNKNKKESATTSSQETHLNVTDKQNVANCPKQDNATKQIIKTYGRASKDNAKTSSKESIPVNVPTHNRKNSENIKEKIVINKEGVNIVLKEGVFENHKEVTSNSSAESIPTNVPRKGKFGARNIILESEDEKSHDEEKLSLADIKKKKYKNVSIGKDAKNTKDDSQFAQDIINTESTVVKLSSRKRSRSSLLQIDTESPSTSTSRPKRVKRKKKSANTSAVENDTSLTINKASSVSGSDKVTCGVCKLEIASAEWIEHIGRKHEYLAWKEGQKWDVNDEMLVKDHYNQILAENGILICYKCGLRRIYVAPFMAHISKCERGPDSASSCNVKDLKSLTLFTESEEYQINHTGEVTCGVCHKTMDGTEWFAHIKISHNYLARIDKYPPLDTNNKDAVYIHIFSLLKQVGELSCVKCGTVRKGVTAYFNHTEQCSSSCDRFTKTSVELLHKDIYECAVCSEQIQASLWNKHAMEKHYNIAWVVGDFPINLDNPYAVTKYLKEYEKRYSLKCKICKETRTSYAGFYAHILTCGKSEEELDKVRGVCELCNYKYLKIYKSQHLNQHKVSESTKEKKRIKMEEQTKPIPKNDELTEEPLGKRRRAAIKATKVINNYTNNNEFKYNCSTCGYSTDVKKTFTRHKCKADVDVVISEESSEESNEDEGEASDELEEQVPLYKKKASSHHAPDFTRLPFAIDNIKKYEIKGGKDFKDYHYTTDVLFSEWRPSKLEVVSETELSQYMPPIEDSCQFTTSKETNWNSLKKFGTMKDKISVIFAGASIRSIAWVPNRKDDSTSEQYLTIACFNGSDCARINYNETLQCKNMIQLWDFGCHANDPKLAMGIAHDFGIVWSMGWCPSGARDRRDATARLGLLAVACSNGSAYVFSVPYPPQIVKDDQLVYKLKPVAELRDSFLPSSERKLYQASALSWSTQKGHEVIVVGYSDGSIACYDLSSKSPLLYAKEDDLDVFYPFNEERAQSTCIEGLDVYPSPDTRAPLGLLATASAFGAALAGGPRARARLYSHVACSHVVFSPNWPAALLSGANAFEQLTGNELELWGGGRRLGPAECCCGCPRCGRVVVSSAPFLKEITTHGAHDFINKQRVALLHEVALDSSKLKKYLNDDLGTPIEPRTYDEVVKKYGIEFKRITETVKPKKVSPPQTRPQRFPLADVSHMAFCPSSEHHKLLAVATHSGLVFLTNL